MMLLKSNVYCGGERKAFGSSSVMGTRRVIPWLPLPRGRNCSCGVRIVFPPKEKICGWSFRMYVEYRLEKGILNIVGKSDSAGRVAGEMLDCPAMSAVFRVSGLDDVRFDGPRPEAYMAMGSL